MIPPKRFDIPPLTRGCSEGLDAFRFFFKHNSSLALSYIIISMLTLNIIRYTVQSSPSGLVGIVFKSSLLVFIFNLIKENLKASKPSNNINILISILISIL